MQDYYVLDTAGERYFEFIASHFALLGQLRFYDEGLLEDNIDLIGLNVNGVNVHGFENIDDVDFEPLFRDFQSMVPYKVYDLQS